MSATHLLRLRIVIIGVFLFCSLSIARANVITDWNRTFETVEKEAGQGSSGRSGAILHIAIFDAVDGITREYAPYYVQERSPQKADATAAAAQAACTILSALYPDQRALLDRQLTHSLKHLTADKQAIAAGRAWGKKVAEKILAPRRTDRYDAAPETFLGSTKPGQWRATPPYEGRSGLMKQIARVVPFALQTPSQFRPAPPPALNSAQYAADLNEIKALGARNSKTRTADQTEIAHFNNDSIECHWNRIARNFVKPDANLLETARLFALLNIAAADAGIFSIDAKYAYNSWRPITAIRLADPKSNPAISPDPKWTPLLMTPLHPDYVSRHCAIAGAAETILIHFFGNNTGFSDTSDALPGVTRKYVSFTAQCQETIEARILGGIHVRTANVVGNEGGRQVATYVLATRLIPLPRHAQ